MPRDLLSIQDIKELNKLLRRVFEYIKNLKNEHLLAAKIKYPQLPSILTESLTIHLLNKRAILTELDGFNFNFGGRIADILATNRDKTIRIEVKATAKSAFEYFGEKDLKADYIIWIHFAEFFMNSEDNFIKIFIIKEPGSYFEKPIKITLTKLKQKIGADLIEKEFDIDSL